MNTELKRQQREASARWRAKNPNYIKQYDEKHKEVKAERDRLRYLNDKEWIDDRISQWLRTRPWYTSFANARARCNNTNNPAYKDYGGRGIKFLMTLEDFKYLWFRDKAYEMEVPTVDRLDSDSNYELSNCEYVELQENGFRAQMKLKKGE
jgi:hypothetical protein